MFNNQNNQQHFQNKETNNAEVKENNVEIEEEKEETKFEGLTELEKKILREEEKDRKLLEKLEEQKRIIKKRESERKSKLRRLEQAERVNALTVVGAVASEILKIDWKKISAEIRVEVNEAFPELTESQKTKEINKMKKEQLTKITRDKIELLQKGGHLNG